MESLVRALGVTTTILALAALSACSGVESDSARGARTAGGTGAPGVDEAGAAAAHEGFLDALRAADARGAAGFLDESAELVLFPVQGTTALEGAEEARRGLEGMFRAIGAAEWTIVHERRTVRGGAAWMTYLFAVEAEGRPEPLLGRGSEVWIRSADGWRLAHGHWSGEPEGR